MRTAHLFASSLLVSSSLVSAQTVLLKEGDPAPNGAFGQSITGVSDAAANGTGGYACSVETDGLSGLVRMKWGSVQGGAQGVLAEPGTFGTATQTGFDNEFGLSSSQAIYRASVDLTTGQTGLDSIWVGTTPYTVAGQPVAGMSGRVFRNLLITRGTDAGVPCFYGTVSDVPGGANLGAGIFLNNAPLLFPGDQLPNAPERIAGVTTDFAVSPNGSHHAIEALLENLPSSENTVLVVDGVILELGGALVQEGTLIPASMGGIGDGWRLFNEIACGSNGEIVFGGRTDAAFDQDGFLARGDGIWMREGDVVDGVTLSGEPEALALGPNGTVAHLWEFERPDTSTSEGIFVNDRLLIEFGEEVDLNGDGALDPGTSIDGFSSRSPLALTADGALYFVALVNTGSASIEALLRMEAGGLISANYCQANANTSGLPATISAVGSSVAADNDLALICADMPTGAFGFFINGQTQGFIPNPAGSAGNLCLMGSIGRFQGQIQNSGPAGTFQIPVDLTAIPRPMGTASVTAGETWNFSTWFRDSDGMGGATSNFSNGLEVVFN